MAGNSEQEKAKKALRYPRFLNFPLFFISWFVLTRKQKSSIVNWRVGDAQSTVHMQDGTCALLI